MEDDKVPEKHFARARARVRAYPSRLSSPIGGLSFSVSSFTSSGRRASIGGKRRVRTPKTYKPKP
jgi:hypothetical protein